MAKTRTRSDDITADLGFEAKLWLAADALRNQIDWTTRWGSCSTRQEAVGDVLGRWSPRRCENQQLDTKRALAVESAQKNGSCGRGKHQDHGVLAEAGRVAARLSPSRTAG